MAILWENDSSTGCTFETWEGAVSFEEWLRHVQAVVTDPNWPAGKRHLVDLKRTKDFSDIFESDLDEVSSLISIYEDRVVGVKLAIIADPGVRKPELFIQFLSTIGVEGKVFVDLAAACQWLNLDPAQAEQKLQQLRNAG